MVFCFLISNTAADDDQSCRGLWLRCLASGLHKFLLHQCLVGKTVYVLDALTSSIFHSSSILLLWKTWILIHLLQPELAQAVGIMYLQMVGTLLLQCFYTIVIIVQLLNHIQPFATPWTVAHQAALSLKFSRQEYWSGLPFLSPGDLPGPEMEHCISCTGRQSHQGNYTVSSVQLLSQVQLFATP